MIIRNSCHLLDCSVGLGGVDISAFAARGEALINSSTLGVGLGGVERQPMEEMPDDADDDIDGTTLT